MTPGSMQTPLQTPERVEVVTIGSPEDSPIPRFLWSGAQPHAGTPVRHNDKSDSLNGVGLRAAPPASFSTSPEEPIIVAASVQGTDLGAADNVLGVGCTAKALTLKWEHLASPDKVCIGSRTEEVQDEMNVSLVDLFKSESFGVVVYAGEIREPLGQNITCFDDMENMTTTVTEPEQEPAVLMQTSSPTTQPVNAESSKSIAATTVVVTPDRTAPLDIASRPAIVIWTSSIWQRFTACWKFVA